MKYRILAISLAIALSLSGCRSEDAVPSPTPHTPDAAADELRGVWVSYLDINPLLRDAAVPAAKARLDTLLETVCRQGLNTVFFHVRAHSDAYYASTVFPPAEAATDLLAAGFDPLAYVITAAHARGLALHAWINPYRIGEDKTAAVCNDVFLHDGVWYYNPAADAARQAVLDGVREILDNYAVDGIHFDDYFYPTTLSAEAQPFEQVPDSMAVAHWRRVQVDALVSAVCGLARTRGRTFGISPTALPHTDREKAYADTAMWMAQGGYVDYLCPQLYFGFAHETHPFTQTLATWESLPRHADVALYIGLALYKSGTADTYAGKGQNEWCAMQDIIARQVTALRKSGKCTGFVLFRYAHLTTASNEMQNLQIVL